MTADAFRAMDESIFEEFGEDGTVRRDFDDAQPVRVVIERNVAVLGEFGQLLGRVTKASFMRSQWQPREGDVLALSTGPRKIQSIESDDGYVAKVVLHGR
jgi:hypothetical protein